MKSPYADGKQTATVNESLRRSVVIISFVFAISGINHGVFEILQGNTPTERTFISAIGPAHRMWVHGEEGAFTVLPSFLLTGIMAVTTSVALAIWAVRGLTYRYGAGILLGLFVLLFLFGGGVAQAPFFLILWAFATRITRPIGWWKQLVRNAVPRWYHRLWRPLTALFVVMMIFSLQAATTGFVPGVRDPDRALTVVLSLVGTSLILSPVIYSSALCEDAAHQQVPSAEITR